jgi:hypothetical protein
MPERSPYEVELDYWSDFVERQRNGRIKVAKDDIVGEISTMGYLGWLLHPQYIKDTVIQDWYVFREDLVEKTGRHRHQGGVALFVVEGSGWTELDGVRHDWEKGDLILIPLRPGGVAHQHFNANPGKPATLLAFVNINVLAQLGSEMVQEEDFPTSGTTT